MTKTRIAIVGPGKIATDQHIPAIDGSPDFELVAAVSRHKAIVGTLPVFGSLTELREGIADLDAVAFCTPPGGRYAAVREALDYGWHTLMEKPPTRTLSELNELEKLVEDRGLVLFTTWHCQFNDSIPLARDMIERDGLQRIKVVWRENVLRWHPGQDWIWQPGGFGVFDPGINALSILTELLDGLITVTQSEFWIPSNRETPIAARMRFESATNAPIEVEFDWREREKEVWDIMIVTGNGRRIVISRGGGDLFVDGVSKIFGPKREYPNIYARFAELIANGRSHVDAAPLRLTGDAFLLARRSSVAPFNWPDEPR